jgi:hypothetical protein
VQSGMCPVLQYQLWCSLVVYPFTVRLSVQSGMCPVLQYQLWCSLVVYPFTVRLASWHWWNSQFPEQNWGPLGVVLYPLPGVHHIEGFIVRFDCITHCQEFIILKGL